MVSIDRGDSNLGQSSRDVRASGRLYFSILLILTILGTLYWTYERQILSWWLEIGQRGAEITAAILLPAVLVLFVLLVQERRRRERERQRRVTAEMRLRRAIDAMHTADEVRSAFLASVSHEFRTPLNAIIGFTELMHTETFGKITPLKYGGYVQHVSKSAQKLLSLVENILDVSECESGGYQIRQEAVPLDGLIRLAQRDLQAEADAKKIRIKTDTPSGMFLCADRSAARRIVGNLLSNAVKFNRVGGVVEVAAWEDDDGAAHITVRDTGCGIERRHVAQSLKPFAQNSPLLARSVEGTGLGLTIVKHLVELHGGSVHLSSTVNVGTAVTIRLPGARFAPERDQRPGQEGSGAWDQERDGDAPPYGRACVRDARL